MIGYLRQDVLQPYFHPVDQTPTLTPMMLHDGYFKRIIKTRQQLLVRLNANHKILGKSARGDTTLRTDPSPYPYCWWTMCWVVEWLNANQKSTAWVLICHLLRYNGPWSMILRAYNLSYPHLVWVGYPWPWATSKSLGLSLPPTNSPHWMIFLLNTLAHSGSWWYFLVVSWVSDGKIMVNYGL